MRFCQDLLVAASYCSATVAGIRPLPLTAIPCSLAHARMSPLRCRLDDVRGRRCSRPALRACSAKGAGCLPNARAFFLFRSISYLVPPTPNRTVSSAGPPSRSSSSATVIFVAIPASLECAGLPAPYKINCHAAVPATRQLPASPAMHAPGGMVSAPAAAQADAKRRPVGPVQVILAGQPCLLGSLCLRGYFASTAFKTPVSHI